MRPRLVDLAILAGVAALAACTSPRAGLPRSPLVGQILTPRPGYEGALTNRRCVVYRGEECITPEIAVYPLASEEVRRTLNELQFICNIGGRRYKVCRDKPGFCRISYRDRFLRGDERVEEFLPVERYQFLLDARARCFNRDSYDFDH